MGMLSAMVRYAAVNNQMKFVQGEDAHSISDVLDGCRSLLFDAARVLSM